MELRAIPPWSRAGPHVGEGKGKPRSDAGAEPLLATSFIADSKEKSSLESMGMLVGRCPVIDLRSLETVSLTNASYGGNADSTMSQTIAGVLQTQLKII